MMGQKRAAMTPSFVDTPLLRIGFEDSGPERGIPLILAHGWPDDPRTWDPVLPALHAACAWSCASGPGIWPWKI